MPGATTLTVFLDTYCALRPDAAVTNPTLLDAYMRWALDNEVFHALGRKVFSQCMAQVEGVSSSRNGKARLCQGIQLRSRRKTTRLKG